MLSAVLHTPTAIEVSIRIMDVFVAMRKALASVAPLLTRLDTIERRQITDQTRNDENQRRNEEMRANIRRCHGRIVKRYRDLYRDDRPIIVSETGVKADYGVRDPRGKAQYTEDFQAEYERLMLEEIFANRDIAGIAIWQFTDAKTYTRTRGLRNRSYGVNTGGLYDLYRRPKLVVDVVRELFTAKSDAD